MDKKNTTIVVSVPDILSVGLSEIIHRHFSCKVVVTNDLSSLYNVSGKILLITASPVNKISKPKLHELFPHSSSLQYLPVDSGLQTGLAEDAISLFDTEKQACLKIRNALATFEKPEETVSNELSRREKEVLLLVAKGLSNKEIADKLSVSVHTVISHRKNISEKIGIKTASGMAMYAVFKKIIGIDDIDLSELI